MVLKNYTNKIEVLSGKMKSEFKFTNKYNMTTEEIKNKPVNIEVGCNLVLIGILTHVEDDYVYGIFDYDNKEYDVMIGLNNEEYSFSLEMVGEDNEELSAKS